MLGTTTDLIHETLIVGVDLFEFVPIPGLALAARIVLNIWDAAQYADVSYSTCFITFIPTNSFLTDESIGLFSPH